MKEDCKISVVMCTYNGAKYLLPQLQSILNQTLQPFEIIIVDDASTDDTIALIKQATQSLPFVKIFSNANNLGFNKNFEYAISLATGDFIAIADQDDIWASRKLEIMYTAYNGTADIVHCNSTITTQPEQFTFYGKQRVKRFEGTDLKQLLFFNTVEGHCMLIKKSFIKNAIPFPTDGYYDWWLAMHAALHNGVQWVNITMVARRLHDNNASVKTQQNEGKRIEVLHALTNIEPYIKKEHTHKGLVQSFIVLLANMEQKTALQTLITNNAASIFFYKSKFALLFKTKGYIKKLMQQLYP